MEEYTPIHAVHDLEKELKLRQGFFDALFNEDDWSFVIKLHAFLEAALSRALSKFMGGENLEEVFANLEMSNSKTGKIAFGKALGILNEDERRLIKNFSELRNDLVHNVSKVDFDFTGFLKNIETTKITVFVKTYSYFSGREEFEYEGKRQRVDDFVRNNPKTAIWWSIIILVGVLYLQGETRESITSIKQQLYERVISMLKDRGLLNIGAES